MIRDPKSVFKLVAFIQGIVKEHIKMKVLVTGANGYVGSQLCTQLLKLDFEVVGCVRKLDRLSECGVEDLCKFDQFKIKEVGDISTFTQWDEILFEVDVVIHTAAYTHRMKPEKNEAQSMYDINVVGTRHLARGCKSSSVKKFIFISSIKVNGEFSGKDNLRLAKFPQAFSKCCKPRPTSTYGKTKLQAELELKDALENEDLDLVIIRPAMIYGSNAPGNMKRLVKFLKRFSPLPLASLQNKRAMCAISNLIDLLITITSSQKVLKGVYLVSDGHDLSFSEICAKVIEESRSKAFLFPFPGRWILFFGSLFRRSEVVKRLVLPLEVDMSHTTEDVGWVPKVTFDEELKTLVKDFDKIS